MALVKYLCVVVFLVLCVNTFSESLSKQDNLLLKLRQIVEAKKRAESNAWAEDNLDERYERFLPMADDYSDDASSNYRSTDSDSSGSSRSLQFLKELPSLLQALFLPSNRRHSLEKVQNSMISRDLRYAPKSNYLEDKHKNHHYFWTCLIWRN